MATTTAKNGINGDGQNGWAEYRRLVLAELERLSSQIAATQAHGLNTQLTMGQALNDAKAAILDKLRDTVRNIDSDYEQKIQAVETQAEKRVKELEGRHEKQINDLKRDLDKTEKKLERTEKKLEKTDKDLTGLKAKAVMLGAIAGFVVALGGLLTSIFMKK